MRALIGLATVAAVAAVLVLLARFLRAGRPTRPEPAQWVADHRSLGDETVVSVELRRPDGTVRDRQPIATIPLAAPDYDARFLAEMARARERVAVLRSESELPAP